ncbi:uncharacterized protein BJX67DRAFT_347500 [Aspergillus lucknowensis]|uniref:NAD(P)-binding protein n=1 Tax=Aspergillus lucknowensis TaxID=176173 RepID=A0ABR4LYA8_9EURO
MTTPVALILGAGPRVGGSVAAKLASKGYSVAIASRSGTGNRTSEGYLSLQADFAKPETVPALFDAVKTAFQAAPSVVVYNAASLTPPPDAASILSIPVERVTSDLNINTVSPYVAAQQAVQAWEGAGLPASTKKTFIYTGNILNVEVRPVGLMLNLGVGKSASAYWLGAADASYAARGYRFFYADERAADGKSIGQALDGPAHAEFFAQLVEHEEGIPWHATFVKGKGYVKF